jgi:hypothetical protein
MTPSDGITGGLLWCLIISLLVFFCYFKTLNLYLSFHEPWFVIMKPLRVNLDLICVMHSWLSFVGVLMHTFDPLCVFMWLTGLWPDNTQQDDSLLLLSDQMEWFRRWYIIISDGVVTFGIRSSICSRVIRLTLITCFTIKLAKIDWILKIRWVVKEWSRSRGPRGNFGFFEVA